MSENLSSQNLVGRKPEVGDIPSNMSSNNGESSDGSFSSSSIHSEINEQSLPSVSITKAPSINDTQQKPKMATLGATLKVGHIATETPTLYNTMRRQSMVIPDLMEVKFQGKVQESSSILGKFAAPEQPDFKDIVSSVLGKSPRPGRNFARGKTIIRNSLQPNNSFLEQINDSSEMSEQYEVDDGDEDEEDQQVEIKVKR